MNKREELIAKYATDMADKFGVKADLDLLKKVVVGLGPSIYNADSEIVSSSDPSEVERVKTNFLIKKLGLGEESRLDEVLVDVLNRYGKSNRNKYRAVIYYMLVKHFNKESVY